MKAKVTTFENKSAGDMDLDEGVFGLSSRPDLIHRMVRWQLAKRRAGTHKVKVIGEIRGTTAKPFKQKGTGRARQGSVRATQFRGGATAHGPVPRDHSHALPKKVRKLALKAALSAKQAEGKLVIVDTAKLADLKTAKLAAHIKSFGWRSVLIIDGTDLDPNLTWAARNIPLVDVLPQQGANVYDIMRRDMLVLTKSAVEALQGRLV
ncbi:MAG: 50S ribosomal protein L4 [Proteobacteria bacterium]|nr:50S ribosomal protein L4 [Pseudomonadota bacterium]MDA1059553.1 50S ribosomal protein L4 [Pseudomonadota bacterium]